MNKVTQAKAHLTIKAPQKVYLLKGEERYKRLYHFTSFDSFVKIWLSKKLLFAPVANVNDIKEVGWDVSSNNPQQLPLYYAYNDIRNEYKQISLTMDKDSAIKGWMSTFMWGVYGDKRKGVCIELDYSRLKFTDSMLKDIVTYKKVLNSSIEIYSKITTMKELFAYVKRNRKRIFFTKQDDWSKEREYRIVSRKDDSLDISNAIVAVYLTSYDSMECKMVEVIVGGQIPVRYVNFADGELAQSIDSKTMRESREQALKDSKNSLIKIFSQAKGHYLKCKDDMKACLLLKEYHNI